MNGVDGGLPVDHDHYGPRKPARSPGDDRREVFFTWAVEYRVVGSLGGLVVTVFGVRFGGLSVFFAGATWLCFVISVLGIGLMMVAIIERDRDDRAAEAGRAKGDEPETRNRPNRLDQTHVRHYQPGPRRSSSRLSA